MRVLFVASWYPDVGTEHNGSFFREQALILQGSGIDVGVLVTRPVRVEDPAWRRPVHVSEEDGITVLRLPLPCLPVRPRVYAAVEEAVHRRLLLRAARILEKRGMVPDVLHAHTVFPGGVSAAVLAQRWQRPWVLTEHRPASLTGEAFVRRAPRIRAAVARANAVTTVSTGFGQALGAHYGTKPWEAVELPVPQAFWSQSAQAGTGRPDEHNAGTRFVHVSHLGENKRIHQMCRAFSEAFAGTSPSPHLDVVGGDPAGVQWARGGVDGLPGADSITFHGRLSREDTAAVMARSDVFVLVSAVETGGAVLSEAQALGLRLVVSDTWGGTFAHAPGLGELVPVDDYVALVSALRRVTDGGAYATPEQIRQRAEERYAPDVFAHRWAKIYQDAVAEHRAGHRGSPPGKESGCGR